MEDLFCHDYSRSASRWGWAIVRFEFVSAETVRIHAFGFKKGVANGSKIETPLEQGGMIVLSMSDGTALYEILRITYKFNPDDLYDADLNCVQHLTGMRIAAIGSDREKQARALAWGKRLQVCKLPAADA